MSNVVEHDIVFLVADKDMQAVVEGLSTRGPSVGFRQIEARIFADPRHDAGCRSGCVEFLRPLRRQYRHAMVLFDHEGCGRENIAAPDLEAELERDLSRNGWDDRAAVVVIEPELEIWVWSDSPEVDRVAGWGGHIPALRDWLVDEGFLVTRSAKPERPKEAFEHAIRKAGKLRSAALFRRLAAAVGLRTCRDRAFLKLTERLRTWFPLPTLEGADTSSVPPPA